MYDVEDDLTLSQFEKLCVDLSDTRRKIDDIKNEKSALEQDYKELSEQIIVHLAALNKDKHHTAFGTISVSKRLTYKVPKSPEDREAFFDYLKAKGIFEDLITVNSQTLNGFAKQELESAQLEGATEFNIPGLGDPTLYESIKLTRKK